MSTLYLNDASIGFGAVGFAQQDVVPADPAKTFTVQQVQIVLTGLIAAMTQGFVRGRFLVYYPGAPQVVLYPFDFFPPNDMGPESNYTPPIFSFTAPGLVAPAVNVGIRAGFQPLTLESTKSPALVEGYAHVHLLYTAA